MDAQQLLQEAQNQSDYLRSAYRTLHQCPEIGFTLPKTLSFVRHQLQQMGLEAKNCGKAGLSVCIGHEHPGPTVLLRADMDALPLREESGLAFAADNGHMHACGHDMHTAMLLGAAQLLKSHQAQLRGCVKLMFQPSEEDLQGAKDMLEAGILTAPKVDAAITLHVLTGLEDPIGTLLVSAPGISAPAADFFEIHLQGRGCHGSMPHTGIDPLTAAAHLLLGLQSIHARELPMGERAALTIGSLQAGTAPNAIPDSVFMRGTLRSFDENSRQFIKQRLMDISHSCAKSFRSRAKIHFSSTCPALKNDETLSRRVFSYAAELLGEHRCRLISADGGGGGSEDFAWISREVPSLMLMLCAGNAEQGCPYPPHHPKVRFDESVLPLGSAVYTWTALRWLEENAKNKQGQR